MGSGTLWIGLTSEAMPSSGGWQAALSSTLQHWGNHITDALAFIPGWAAALLLAAVVLLLVRAAFRELLGPSEERAAPPPDAQAADDESDVLAHEYAPGRV